MFLLFFCTVFFSLSKNVQLDYSYALKKLHEVLSLFSSYFKSSLLHTPHKEISFKIYLTALYKRMCSLVMKHFKL